jgi:excisionase family DNA binding protein
MSASSGAKGKALENATGKLAYNIQQVCELSGLCRATIYTAIRNGELKARKRGTRTLVLPDDLKSWLEGLPVLGAA